MLKNPQELYVHCPYYAQVARLYIMLTKPNSTSLRHEETWLHYYRV